MLNRRITLIFLILNLTTSLKIMGTFDLKDLVNDSKSTLFCFNMFRTKFRKNYQTTDISEEKLITFTENVIDLFENSKKNEWKFEMNLNQFSDM